MSRPPQPGVAVVARALAEAGAGGEVRLLPVEARTAAAAAAALDVPVGAVVDSLVLLADGSPVLVLASGAHRVDAAQVAALLGVSTLVPAPAPEVRRHTGQPAGGVAPLGHPAPLGTLVDVELARYARVWAAAGHPAAVFPTTYDELIRITAGTAAEVGDGALVPQAVAP
jgi:prolyl-tRNA editing enzyme YbaK/EbsC (Cys-tRNA(Pro) deacylase)